MNYVPHRKLSLKSHPQLTEVWLHERIAENPALLGLGELEVLARERIQHAGGRLDLLLADFENDIRYEVEVMLGATDPSHIIRTIEYWDIERRRYPAYEHIAVLVAEDITSRFLNVISLLSGTIPIVAIKLNALEVDGKVLLDFVKVLDQRALRVDETVESTRDFEERDRAFWEAKRGPISLAICDRLLEITNEKADPPAELRWRKTRVVIAPKDSSRNAATMYPRLKSVLTKFFPEDPAALAADFESAGLDAKQGARGELQVSLSMDELREHESVVRACLHESMARAQLG